MADPISIVTGVAGAIGSSYKIIKLIGSVKDAPAQAAIAVADISETLDKIVAGNGMTLVGRAKWVAWDEEKMSGLVARLQRHKTSLSTLVIVLTGYGFKLSPSSWYS
jgi:hypothetical protein